MMTRPAHQSHQAKIFALQRRESWGVLWVLGLGFLVGYGLGKPALIAKSVALGACLSYVSQAMFTFIAYRLTGAKARRLIVLHLYLGQMVKWVLTLLGFAIIFMVVKPISAPAVLSGYLFMLVWHMVMMWRLRL